jgi:hypothetical protein
VSYETTPWSDTFMPAATASVRADFSANALTAAPVSWSVQAPAVWVPGSMTRSIVFAAARFPAGDDARFGGPATAPPPGSVTWFSRSPAG